MFLRNISRFPRNIQRVIEILTTLWRHGLGHIVTRLNVQENLPIVARIVTRGKVELLPPDNETVARRLSLVFQELGPTFIKMGQILATRPDFVPEPFLEEFRKLQDKVKPFPTTDAKLLIEEELERPLKEVFREFDEEPLASGSIAQVYAAKLLDGTPVVVKVRRPNIEKKIDSDLDILRYFAKRAQKNWPEINPLYIVEEFDKSIHREMDFVVEASYTSKFYEFFLDMPGVKSPRVYWDCTSRKVLTVERFDGIRVDDVEQLDERGIDRAELACRMGKAFMKQYVDFGLFQADPHPGNISVSKNGTIQLVDFGMTGHLTDELLSEISTAIIAISQQNLDILIDTYAEMSDGVIVDRRMLKSDLLQLFDKYYGMPLKRIDMATVVNETLEVARKHGLMLPRDFVMLLRSVVIVTGVGRTLDPDFNLSELVEPEARRLLLRKASPKFAARRTATYLWRTSRILQHLPEHIRTLISKVEAGELTVVFRHQGLEGIMSELDRVSNRLAVSIILGSIIVGSSIVNVPAIGIAGYIIAAILGLWLVWDILRSGRY